MLTLILDHNIKMAEVESESVESVQDKELFISYDLSLNCLKLDLESNGFFNLSGWT